MKLIVGLGNPGEKYKNSRHNLGFKIIDLFCEKNEIILSKSKFNGIYIRIKNGEEEYIILKPMNYMNNSGEVIYLISSYFGIDIKDILVIYDDKDILFNEFKIQDKGSSAGHNGIKDIIKHLDHDNFIRLRCGIGPVKKNSIMDFVMDNFSKEELEKINLEIYLKIIEKFIKKDFEYIKREFFISKINRGK